MFGDWAVAASIIEVGSSFVVITVVFAMIYKIVPRVRIDWKDVWIGAAATSLLFTVGKFLIGVYIGRSGIASGFGAAASLVVVLVWVYYSAQIFLLGAEFTWAYAHKFGSRRHLASEAPPPCSLQRRHPPTSTKVPHVSDWQHAETCLPPQGSSRSHDNVRFSELPPTMRLAGQGRSRQFEPMNEQERPTRDNTVAPDRPQLPTAIRGTKSQGGKGPSPGRDGPRVTRFVLLPLIVFNRRIG